MVLVQLAERRIPIQYAGKGSLGFGGGQSAVGRRTYLPLKNKYVWSNANNLCFSANGGTTILVTLMKPGVWKID